MSDLRRMRWKVDPPPIFMTWRHMKAVRWALRYAIKSLGESQDVSATRWLQIRQMEARITSKIDAHVWATK